MELVSKCPMCNSENLEKVHKHIFKKSDIQERNKLKILFSEFLDDKEDVIFFISFCRKCGFLFLNPRFDEDDYKKIFSENTKENTREFVISRIPRGLFFYNYLKKWIRKLQIRPSGDKLNILDYGGAAGYNLLPYVKDNNCYIIDYIKYNLPDSITYLGRNENNLKNDLYFDIIISTHVFEHINDPVRTLRQLFLQLKENGIIYIQVPLGCFIEYKSLNTPFRHINFFSEQSLFNLFKKVGLKVVHINTNYTKIDQKHYLTINIIGIKSREGIQKKIKFHTTKYQMSYFLYYLRLLISKDKIKLENLFKSLKKISKKLVQKIS